MWYLKITKKKPYELECKVDSKIFNEKVVLKAMYELVDKVYMFIETTKDGNFKVYFKLKPETKEDLVTIVDTFWEELVYHRLRYDLDRKYGKLREKIIETALGFGLSLDDLKEDLKETIDKLKTLPLQSYSNEIKKDDDIKSIDDIIAEIENDPDFADDKDEIISILKEIEEENEK